MSARQPRVTLFFPPHCETALDGPHLGVHQLVAHLRRDGIACRSYDLNVRFFRWLAERGGRLDRLVAQRADEFTAIQVERGTTCARANAFRGLVTALAYAPPALLRERFDGRCLSSEPASTADANGGSGHWWRGDTSAFLHYFEQLHPKTNGTVTSACDAASTNDASLFGEFYSQPHVDALLEDAAQCDVVGINVSFGIQLEAALRLAQTVRRRSARPFIVLGGTQICLLDHSDVVRLARLPFVDGVILYEGETPLAALCRAVAHGCPVAGVPNLVRILPDGTVSRTASAEPIHPNDLAPPEFDDDELKLYRELTLPVYVTRGCYWGKCTFCDYVKLYTPGQPRVAWRNALQVVDDVKRLQSRHRAFRFRLITEAIPPKWCREFCRAIVAHRVRASFWTYLKNEPKEVLTQDLFDLMKRAGIDDVTCGVESTSDRVLSVIVKGTSREDITDNFEMMNRAGIRAVFNVIPDYPTVTHEEALDGLQYIVRHKDLIPVVNFQMFDLSIKSSIAGCPESYGLTLPSTTTFVQSPHGAHSLAFRRTVGLTPPQHRALRSAYQRIRRDIAVHHATVRNRERIAARGFDWSKAAFVFRTFCAVEARLSLEPTLHRARTWFVLLPALATYIEFPGRMNGFLAAIADARQKPVTYDDLFAAYSRPFGKSFRENGNRKRLERAFRRAIRALVQAGFVEEVVTGPGLPSDESIGDVLSRPKRSRRATGRATT